jgi:hypothetical protein
VLVTVTDWLALDDPSATTPKFNVVADNVMAALPLPLRLTFCGLFDALSVKVNVPLAAPVAVGVNVT